MFTTYDRDYERSLERNCAAVVGSGFWYNQCSHLLVNGITGINWDTASVSGDILYLKYSRTQLMCH